jgi:hypothetical protein
MQKNNLWRKGLLILLTLFICILPVLFGLWLIFGCLWLDCADSGYFVSEDIQIPREFFPNQTTYSNLSPDRESWGAKQHEVQQIYWGNSNSSTALLHVYRYFGTFRAKRGFSTQIRILSELFDISLEMDNTLNYQSTFADQLFIGCSIHKCIFVARYDEDLISLNMTIDNQMTIRDFEHIVVYLDTIVSKRLGH